jgi:hypothetical protein
MYLNCQHLITGIFCRREDDNQRAVVTSHGHWQKVRPAETLWAEKLKSQRWFGAMWNVTCLFIDAGNVIMSLFLKGTIALDFRPLFFHQRTYLGVWVILYFFQIWFQIRGVIWIEVWFSAAWSNEESDLIAASRSGKSELSATKGKQGVKWMLFAEISLQHDSVERWTPRHKMQRGVISYCCIRQRKV